MPLSQPEPIPSTPKVPISSLPYGLDGAFLWGPVNWPGEENRYATAFRLQGAPGLICFPSSGATVVVAESDLVIPSPLKAGPA